MKLPDSFQKYLRAHIDFSSFILLDMVIIDDTKSAVFLVPRNDETKYCNLQINNESKFYGSFGEMMEYAIHFKLISEGYKKDLIKRYETIKQNGGNK